MKQVLTRISLAVLLAGYLGVGAGCQKESSEAAADETEGTFEEIGKGVDNTQEAAEETVKEAQKTADTIEDAVDGDADDGGSSDSDDGGSN